MPALARLAAALAALAAPFAPLAQEAGGRGLAAPRAGYSWLWLLAGVLVVVALFRLLVGGRRGGADRPRPPARHP